MKNRSFLPILLVFTIIFSSGCADEMSGRVLEENAVEDNHLLAEEVITVKTDDFEYKSAIDGMEIYAQIISSYETIEWEGFIYNDFLYAFQDINGDKQPELFIGVNLFYSDNTSIISIYTLQSDKPISIAQAVPFSGARNSNIYLLSGFYHNYVIEQSWGSFGSATEQFYILDDDGHFVLIDSLETEDYDMEHYMLTEELIRNRIRWLNNGDSVIINEDEYIRTINEYGSSGYETLIDIAKRPIELNWNPIIKE